MATIYYKDIPYYTDPPLEVKNPNYNWWTNADETIIVREDTSDTSHKTYRWYFKDFEFTDYYMPIPSELARFVPSSDVGCCGWCADWYDPDEHPDREPNCVVGFYGNTIRMWTIGLGSNMIGTCNMCIIESTDNSISDQVYHGWIEPTFDPING